MNIDDLNKNILLIKQSNKIVESQEDSTILYYQDISNCIKEDFEIKNGKINFKNKKK